MVVHDDAVVGNQFGGDGTHAGRRRDLERGLHVADDLGRRTLENRDVCFVRCGWGNGGARPGWTDGRRSRCRGGGWRWGWRVRGCCRGRVSRRWCLGDQWLWFCMTVAGDAGRRAEGGRCRTGCRCGSRRTDRWPVVSEELVPRSVYRIRVAEIALVHLLDEPLICAEIRLSMCLVAANAFLLALRGH